ncbi:precorrin-3B C(17)-methyltransferase [Paractinoplanes abujensis]|uniref:Precorrin-2 C20-methyltransferase/precorrin-3B C17-methyltransferase n=1 Tax=Paractinoplanes abujensis TaxID=882441 RepID=A0A7W7G6S0_9ACTN|nr:precorrin-2 C(20)-methyltransferase [Actinoplanes abujensis]MBB4697690.1 precorrin-2 C20-methyltransferase/precorrin-3B C17-methyltransferase [Actinoplanes abujensis]GID19822.1 precorrin-3B C(17)-methyltransferase [Actinoplanes abujensis]
MTGKLYGVGVGPGDPELITLKAARLIESAAVVAYHAARHGRSNARAIAAGLLREGQIEEPLIYPVTTEVTDHPGGYQGAIDEFYTAAADRLAAHLDAGRDVVVLAEGDPFFYGSYMHMHKRLAHRYDAEVVPGVTSVSAASAVLGRPLMERDEILTVLPGTLPPAELAARLAATDSAAVMKLGRTFDGVREALAKAGRLDDTWYVERATTDRERHARLTDVDPESVPYFSLALLPSPAATAFVEGEEGLAARGEGEESAAGDATGAAGPVKHGSVTVVGLGPGDPMWLTAEARGVLAAADDLIGYQPYLDRVATGKHQRKHPSDNRVEAERAAFALDLAKRGRNVAVVSSGDPGVFAMAAAVLEVSEDPQWKAVPVRVVPGLTAAQAVASRAGAPLGHDFCILSLSDRLKPWPVIADRLTAAARADFVIAIYNPASKSRREQLVNARSLLLEQRDPATPVVVGRDVGGPQESVRVTTLGDLDPATIDMRCLLIIGSSQTRTVTRGDGSAAVYTPRTYPTAP